MVTWDGYSLLNSVAEAMMHFHNDFKKNRTTIIHKLFDWNQLNRLGSLNCRYSTKAHGLECLFRCWWRYSYKATRPTNTARGEYRLGLSGFYRWEHLTSFYFEARENRAWFLHIPIFTIHTGFYFARPGGSADPYFISYSGTLATFFVSKCARIRDDC